MKFSKILAYVPLAAMLALTSCARDVSESYSKFEEQALEAWITQNRPDLIGNKQDPGGYYVDVLSPGSPDATPLGEQEDWVRFGFTGRDLSGNIVMTRNASDAILEGTFTKYTRYVPFYRYCGEENTNLIEGTYLAMRNTLTLSQAYYDKYKDERGLTSPEVKLRVGSRVRLYMPSSVVGSGGIEGSGGYEGQYSLDARRPMIVEMEIRDTVKNPLQREGSNVDTFCDENGGRKVYNKAEEDKDDDKDSSIPEDPEDENHPYNVKEDWVSACDTIAQLYVNYRYTPNETLKFSAPYSSGFEPYKTTESMASIDQRINAKLKERFYPDEESPYEGVKELDADSVKLDGTAKIWYIGRFLDGFIFDTNIDEVKEIIYGEVKSKGTALSYTPSSGGAISAFYYTVPHLKYGQWAALITTSTNAYGSSGKSGSSSTSSSGSSSSSYVDYMNYMNYMNNYYGNSGYYGGYYNNYYNNYYGGYYGGYGSGDSTDDTSTTTTTVTTEIPPFTPLIFQLYVMPE